MRTFAYKGFDSSGAVRRGLIEAQDLKEAREKLMARGVLPQDVSSSESAAGSVLGSRRGMAFKAESRVAFYRELGVLLGAGLPLVSAIEILMESPELGVSPSLLAGVRDRIREGASLAVSLSAMAPYIKPYEKAILEVGEKSGNLETMLERLALFLEEQEHLRERIVSALIYPAIILVFAILVAVVLLGFVVPAAASVISEQSDKLKLPLLTLFMMALGRVMLFGVPVAMLIGLFGRSYFKQRMAVDPALRFRVDQWLFKMPLVGRGYTIVANLRCARTLSILLQGGVGLVDALALAGRSTGSVWVAHLMEEEAESIRHGSSLADAVRRIPPLARSLPAWIQAGEASGALERLLETAGNAYQHQWNRYVSRTLSWLEPVLILAIGIFVLLVTLSVLLPIIALNQTLG
ncbi:MAG: type II secretion system F family protein [bacterium]|jgi:general secretion pathway protein F